MTLEEKYNLLKYNKYFEYFTVKTAWERRDLTRDELMEIWKVENEENKKYISRYENPYMKIQHFFDTFVRYFTPEDTIVIQEKIDGSNAHMRVYQAENGDLTFSAYSQNCELNSHNSLEGFWYFANEHFKQVPEKYYELDIYGEWLTPHSCEYPADAYGKFYVFDVMENGNYWTQDKVESLAKECDFIYVPTFYAGKFQSWRHTMSFIGKTQLGGTQGEGIVIKNQSKLNTNHTFYAKIVSQEFQELLAKREHIKAFNLDRVLELSELRELAESIVTLARVRKIVHKLVSDGTLSANWKQLEEKESKSKIYSEVYRDCMAEAPEVVERIGKRFGTYCGDLARAHLETLKNE